MSSPNMLSLPDAEIGYDVRGAGPVLFVVGAPAGRAAFEALAGELERDYTVVTHDPRGIGSSTRLPGAAEPTPQVLAADLLALVEFLDPSPALFFGSSGGAVTLLELLRRRPEVALRVVVHEPPLIGLLDDSQLLSRAAAAFAAAEEDPQRAAQEFADLSQAMHRTPKGEQPPPSSPLPPLPASELDKNRYFLGHMAGPTVFYEPELSELSSTRVVPAAGELSHGQLARRATEELAAGLDRELVDMPGNHMAASTEPATFGRSLHELLGA
jgi:pimeloyl-ACP methyl ester carboxylesterase